MRLENRLFYLQLHGYREISVILTPKQNSVVFWKMDNGQLFSKE